ncbi:MAG: FAD-dependent oxidoreductase [Balneolaceae bacterium]
MSRIRIDEILEKDVLIVGAGAAGVRTAIELQKNNISCLIVSRRRYGDAHTWLAAGGVNASLGSLDPEDRWQIHAADTLREGHYLNDAEAVAIVTSHAPEVVKELHDWGCPFSKTPDGRINQRYFGAQSFRRTCFAGDRTGRAILDTLTGKAREKKIPYRDNIAVIKILKQNGRVSGALALDRTENKVIFYKSPAVVLATGGYAAVYSRSTSRAGENLGDGISLAFEAEAVLMDMEMVQFHPTAMVKPPGYEGSLVTEAVRGEGGKLFNNRMERFIEKYSPDKMELDARDVVARAIITEIREGRGTKENAVYLDISGEKADFIKERLPGMVEKFREVGVDITREAIEAAPASHYSMGGLQVDFGSGRTTVEGLFAAGEVTAGLHGANRLGGNSLVETLVSGRNTGKYIADNLKGLKQLFASDNGEAEDEAGMIMEEDGYDRPADAIRKIRDIMWEHAGIIRNGEGLKKGLRELARLAEELRSEAKPLREIGPGAVEESLGVRNVLGLSEIILKSALKREESRGAHFREDFPDENTEWQKNILCKTDTEGGVLLRTRTPKSIPGEIKKALSENHEMDYHHLE